MGVTWRFKGIPLAFPWPLLKLSSYHLFLEYRISLSFKFMYTGWEPLMMLKFYFDIQMVPTPFSDASKDWALPVTRGITFFCGLSSVTDDSSIIRGYKSLWKNRSLPTWLHKWSLHWSANHMWGLVMRSIKTVAAAAREGSVSAEREGGDRAPGYRGENWIQRRKLATNAGWTRAGSC